MMFLLTPARRALPFLCLLLPLPALAADDGSFARWLAAFKEEARAAGIAAATLESAFAQTEPDDSIIALDRKQPEGRLTLTQYLQTRLTPRRIRDGRRFLEENAALLAQVGRQYGVQPRFIVALWGTETDYGRYTGHFVLTDALATLAYDGRRAAFFRGELLDALRILEAEGMEAEALYGSWAGAMGQCQFMPGTYLRYAVDFDGDGRRDVWDSKADIFASIAHYLQSLGWKAEEGWGRPVRLPEGFDMTLADIRTTRPLSEWQALGIRRSDGGDLPQADIAASLITIGEGEQAHPYLVYSNFKALLQWNRSRYFATSVGMLADAIAP